MQQGYYNNQTNYPMQPAYGYGQPAYGYPQQQVVPVQTQPNTVVISEHKKTSDGDACCAGFCAGCLAVLCCCCLAAAASGPRHRGRF